MGNGLGLGSMNTFLTPPSHRPKAARDVPDNGLPAGMNMDVSDLHALFAAAPHVCQHLRLDRKGSEQLVGRVGGRVEIARYP
jgi:hypothetical protein